ncbi:polycystin-2-like isoform X1 [Daktulosphaira vitifoliae]|uniref:polycystin-2-like isoform X1 n=1 Tax=Daktulosphaira vitifoliae TaxID=58002 RepID=UPI0021A9D21C|nr:polycystin-2-like isoform X1 [Daktulosphaira vitifoliae]
MLVITSNDRLSNLLTRQIATDLNNRELYVQLSIHEMCIYGLFFILFCISCCDMYTYDVFALNQEISSLFLDSSFEVTTADGISIKFHDIITMEHLWKYFYEVLCNKLYGLDNSNMLNVTNSEIIYRNKLLFKPRVRQVRVEEGHCEIRNQFKGLFKECYVPFDTEYEEKRSFGPANDSQWLYSGETRTQGTFYSGKISYYGPGGYYFDFPERKEDAKQLIDGLKMNTWLDRATRAIFIDFAAYNGNTDTLCVVKLKDFLQ